MKSGGQEVLITFKISLDKHLFLLNSDKSLLNTHLTVNKLSFSSMTDSVEEFLPIQIDSGIHDTFHTISYITHLASKIYNSD